MNRFSCWSRGGSKRDEPEQTSNPSWEYSNNNNNNNHRNEVSLCSTVEKQMKKKKKKNKPMFLGGWTSIVMMKDRFVV